MNSKQNEMINIHALDITLDEIQAQLNQHPLRLEERSEDEEEYDDGNTPLIAAAAYGNTAVVNFLLSMGANVEAKNTVCKRFKNFHEQSWA